MAFPVHPLQDPESAAALEPVRAAASVKEKDQALDLVKAAASAAAFSASAAA